jgi:membrane protein DedA with SNARE-associated domain
MERGWDPEVKKYFRKIMNSFATGLLWMMVMVFIGLYHGWAFVDGRPDVYNIIFYVVLVISLALLIRYYYRLWKK